MSIMAKMREQFNIDVLPEIVKGDKNKMGRSR